MPHVLLERLRQWPKPFEVQVPVVKRKDSPLFAYCIEISEIIAGVIFVLGSVCFLPSFSKDLDIFLAGCALFIVGAVIYVICCHITHYESLMENGLYSYEATEHLLYTVGSWFFLVGTVLYWPEEAHHKSIEALQGCSLGQYFNLFTPEYEGTILFIIGSVLFGLAALTNALNQRKYDDESHQLLVFVNSLFGAGSILFVIGSVLFLPDLGCNTMWLSIGAWCFIIGSLFYLIGSCISFCRTVMVQNMEQEEKRKLLDKDTAA